MNLEPVTFFTEDEELFQRQLANALESAMVYINTERDLYPLYLYLTKTIECVFVRSEKVYPNFFKAKSPDYLDILCMLEVMRGRVRYKITKDNENRLFD